MIYKVFEQLTIEKRDFTQETLDFGIYEDCRFIDCDFSNVDLSNFTFSECSFHGCNFSNVIFKNTSLKVVHFIHCKLLGIIFYDCNKFLFSVDFEQCNLSYSSFYRLKIKKTKFNECLLQEVDFTETDLSNSVFYRCDFRNSLFDRTILEGCDFRTSFNYSIDPENNRIKKAKFALQGVVGLLLKYDIIVE